MTQQLWGSATESFSLDYYKKRLKQECDLQFAPEFDWRGKKEITHDVNIILSRLRKDIIEFSNHCHVPVKATTVFYGKLCVRYLAVMVKRNHDRYFEELVKTSQWGNSGGKKHE